MINIRNMPPRSSKLPALTALALAVSAVSAVPVASAQEEGGARTLEEVVITARRRTESLEDVPVAVTAFGAQQILERGIRTEADLQVSTPGLMVRVTNSSNQINYSLRGQSVDSFSNSQPAVLAYVNEVQAGGVTGNFFFDLQSIQVLKGPQGTLFGRNATGGAILYQTQLPEQEFGGYVKVGAGNFSNQEIEGAINIPMGDQWAMRFSGLTRERDGWQDNLYNGDELASIDTDNIRFSLSFNGDRLQNHFMAYWAEHGGKTEGLRVRNAYNCLSVAPPGICLQGEPNPNNPSVDVGDLLFATVLYPEGSLPFLSFENPRLAELGAQMGFAGYRSFIDVATAQSDFDEVYNDQTNDSDIEHQLFTNTTTWEINDSMTLKNILGYNNVESFQGTDIDGSPFMLMRMGDEFVSGGFQYDTEQFSEELQLSGQAFNDKLDYIVGLYWYEETFENDIPLKFIADYPNDPFGPAFTYNAEIEDTSYSVFAQGTYALTDVLNLTLGARYTWEEISIRHLPGSAYAPVVGTGRYENDYDRPSWLASLDYRINDENMIYATTRGSWRTGGWNVTSLNDIDGDGFPDTPDSFKPEKTWDIEGGWKFSGTLGSVPARVNLAIYQQTIEDVQRTVYLQITSQTGNVGEAEVKGVEIDAQFDLTDWLEVGAAYAYTDAEFTDPQGDVAGYEFEFGPYADAPENMYSLYFVTRTQLAGIGFLTFRGDYYHTDETYFSNLNDSIGPGTELDEYDLLNFRLSLDEIAGSGFSAVAFIRNATDEEYERGGLPLAGVTATNGTIAGEPRTYGVEVSYRF